MPLTRASSFYDSGQVISVNYAILKWAIQTRFGFGETPSDVAESILLTGVAVKYIPEIGEWNSVEMLGFGDRLRRSKSQGLAMI
jgi:hypothetical protein